MSYWRFASLVGVSVFCSACGGSECAADRLQRVFSDFKYVGEFPIDKAVPIAPHSDDVRSLPTVLRPNTAYVFHSIGKLSTEEAALKILPERLRGERFNITDAPRSSGEFAIPNSGGPMWTIRFEHRTCRGEIHNVVDPALYGTRAGWPAGARDDYILVIQR